MILVHPKYWLDTCYFLLQYQLYLTFIYSSHITVESTIKKREKEPMPKMKQWRFRAITIIEECSILLSGYW